MSHGSWEEIKAQRADDPEAQAGYAQARRAYEVGREVRRLREEAGLTQRQLAGRAGMTQSVIARLEPAAPSRPWRPWTAWPRRSAWS
jgi:ribosome-binding protein aMBF1 (putative translation factor)